MNAATAHDLDPLLIDAWERARRRWPPIGLELGAYISCDAVSPQATALHVDR